MPRIFFMFFFVILSDVSTGKSLSEALIFASTNPQYDNRLFIELQVQYMKIPSSNLGKTCCVQKLFLTFRTIFVHNMFSPCSVKRRASDKDLPVLSSQRSYQRWLDKRIYKTEMKFWAVLSSRGCREKNSQLP
jgi:hypothetical protein